MATFSGTNLPPIVRLGGSTDVPHSIDRGTASTQLPPRHVQYRYLAVPTITLKVIELATHKGEDIGKKGPRKGRVRRSKQR